MGYGWADARADEAARFGTEAFYASLGRAFVTMCAIVPALFLIEAIDIGLGAGTLDTAGGIIPHRIDGLARRARRNEHVATAERRRSFEHAVNLGSLCEVCNLRSAAAVSLPLPLALARPANDPSLRSKTSKKLASAKAISS